MQRTAPGTRQAVRVGAAARVPGHSAAQPLPACICPCAEGEPGCRCARSEGALISPRAVYSGQQAPPEGSLDPERGGWEGWGGVRLVSKPLPCPPGHLTSRPPPGPQQHLLSPARSGGPSLRSCERWGEGAERRRAFPTQPLSCRFHSSSCSQRLHPARSSQS